MRNAEVLSEAQIKAIHEGALDVLSMCGVTIEHQQAQELLHGYGAIIDDKGRVKIPPALVERALASAPPVVNVYSRQGEQAMAIGGDNQYYGGNVEELRILDEATQEIRVLTSQDRNRFARLLHGLEHYDFMMCGGAAADVPMAIGDFLSYSATAARTTKPVIFSATKGSKGCEQIRRAAAILMGSEQELAQKPCFINLSDPHSPLRNVYEGLDNLLFCAEHNIPILYLSYILMGMSGPVTFMGALVQAHAESLSGLVVNQLAKAGAPFIYATMPAPFDMRTTIGTYGSPELHMLMAASAQVAHYFRLPYCGAAGVTESMYIDGQALAETTMSLQSFAYSRANMAHDIGAMYHCSMASVPMLVLLNETIAMIKALTQEIPLSDEDLALEVIKEIGPGGNFLTHKHTKRNFKRIWYPQLFDRSMSKGGGAILDKVGQGIERALAQKAPDLSPEQQSLLSDLEAEWWSGVK